MRARDAAFRRPTRPYLTFAFLLRIVTNTYEVPDASSHKTAARDTRLSERVHHSARICAESRGNRAALRPLFARHGAQAPDEPPGERLHQTRLEPEPIGGNGADADGRPRGRAADARLRRRRPADRGGRVQ